MKSSNCCYLETVRSLTIISQTYCLLVAVELANRFSGLLPLDNCSLANYVLHLLLVTVELVEHILDIMTRSVPVELDEDILDLLPPVELGDHV